MPRSVFVAIFCVFSVALTVSAETKIRFRNQTIAMDNLIKQGWYSRQSGRLSCRQSASSGDVCAGISPQLKKPIDFRRIRTEKGRKKTFVEWLGPAAQYWGMITGIPPSLIVAQIGQETGFGTSSRFQNQNNLSSIYCANVSSIKTSLGQVDIKRPNCNGKPEEGHRGKMATPSNYQHALMYHVAYLTSMEKTYPILKTEVDAAKRMGAFEMATVESLLKSTRKEPKTLCGGKWGERPIFALTKYACDPGNRDALEREVRGYTKYLDNFPCQTCLSRQGVVNKRADATRPKSKKKMTYGDLSRLFGEVK